ncbi:MAG: 1-aminocyclopropane-1-carboxylate deaminase/D-cysteine desulfhydrase [Candidatus Cyclobacteriaceae bacterium M3_2C_046]
MAVPIIKLSNEITRRYQVELFLKREDLLHPLISGNKVRKLKYNILQAKKEQKTSLLTFGGAYSNHIFAVAAAGQEFGFKTIGIIRGEAYQPLNPTLQFALDNGMHLHYFSRQQYRQKYHPQVIESLEEQFGNFYLVPEGGSNRLALPGCAEIWQELEQNFDFLCTPVGTGGTLAGLISGNQSATRLLGFPVLKGGEYLKEEIEKLLLESGKNPISLRSQWQLITNYHLGGYAKFNTELIDFINNFKATFGVPLDPVYTGKMMFAIFDLIKNRYFLPGTKILALHTGGLQGIAGFNQRFGDLIR